MFRENRGETYHFRMLLCLHRYSRLSQLQCTKLLLALELALRALVRLEQGLDRQQQELDRRQQVQAQAQVRALQQGPKVGQLVLPNDCFPISDDRVSF